MPTEQGLVWTRVEASLLVVIQLCQRTTGKMDEVQREVQAYIDYFNTDIKASVHNNYIHSS